MNTPVQFGACDHVATSLRHSLQLASLVLRGKRLHHYHSFMHPSVLFDSPLRSSDLFCSFYSLPLLSTLFRSLLLSSAPFFLPLPSTFSGPSTLFCFLQLPSTPYNSLLLSSASFCSLLLSSVPFCSLLLRCVLFSSIFCCALLSYAFLSQADTILGRRPLT